MKYYFYRDMWQILLLPTYNSANKMFAVLNIPSFGELLGKFALNVMIKISVSINVCRRNEKDLS